VVNRSTQYLNRNQLMNSFKTGLCLLSPPDS
jgi:hypothetical protein